uniref:Uncharacterized protein n=1 Tax=Oryza sativa subsp. japonica TaxID=39947 RepID=Q9FW57_ORYSJ|nr:hypothetical protein [Oryza sativa Japonica Group]
MGGRERRTEERRGTSSSPPVGAEGRRERLTAGQSGGVARAKGRREQLTDGQAKWRREWKGGAAEGGRRRERPTKV